MRMESILQEFDHKLNYWQIGTLMATRDEKSLDHKCLFFLIITEWAHEWVYQIVFMAIRPIWGDIQL